MSQYAKLFFFYIQYKRNMVLKWANMAAIECRPFCFKMAERYQRSKMAYVAHPSIKNIWSECHINLLSWFSVYHTYKSVSDRQMAVQIYLYRLKDRNFLSKAVLICIFLDDVRCKQENSKTKVCSRKINTMSCHGNKERKHW